MTRVLVLAALACGGTAVADGEIAVMARTRTTVQLIIPVLPPLGPASPTVRRPAPVTIDTQRKLDPAKTAVVVCDMWDDHWCKAAASRCGELARAADPVLKACRERGMMIVHAPSDCMDFYKDHPARKRMLAVKKVEPPPGRDLPNPPLPVDDSDGGCDDEKPVKPFKAWTRQHPAITIDGEKDYISESGTEVYSLMAGRGITTLLVMGVHTNMCVLNRSFAIKQMVRWGKDVYLVRDLTDALYNPKMRPFVTHQKGTELIIEFIEQNWCPTIESKSLTAK